MSKERLRVPPEKLARDCNPDELGFETTDEVSPLEGTIGQERAINALEMGLDIDKPGFNLYLSGLPGTGRNTALRSYVDGIAANKPIPPDWGYVYNFQDPSQPKAISLPCGMIRVLADDMRDLVHDCRLDEAMKEIAAKRESVTAEMEKTAEAAGFALRSTPMGISPVPVKEGRPMTPEEFNALPEDERKQLEEKAEAVQQSIGRVTAELTRLNKLGSEQAGNVDKEVVRFALKPVVDELQAKYAEYPEVVAYLDEVESDVVEHPDMFKP